MNEMIFQLIMPFKDFLTESSDRLLNKEEHFIWEFPMFKNVTISDLEKREDSEKYASEIFKLLNEKKIRLDNYYSRKNVQFLKVGMIFHRPKGAFGNYDEHDIYVISVESLKISGPWFYRLKDKGWEPVKIVEN